MNFQGQISRIGFMAGYYIVVEATEVKEGGRQVQIGVHDMETKVRLVHKGRTEEVTYQDLIYTRLWPKQYSMMEVTAVLKAGFAYPYEFEGQPTFTIDGGV